MTSHLTDKWPPGSQAYPQCLALTRAYVYKAEGGDVSHGRRQKGYMVLLINKTDERQTADQGDYTERRSHLSSSYVLGALEKEARELVPSRDRLSISTSYKEGGSIPRKWLLLLKHPSYTTGKIGSIPFIKIAKYSEEKKNKVENHLKATTKAKSILHQTV